jgi:hypothetical protein
MGYCRPGLLGLERAGRILVYFDFAAAIIVGASERHMQSTLKRLKFMRPECPLQRYPQIRALVGIGSERRFLPGSRRTSMDAE